MVANIRVIPRLDIKGPNLIKGIQLEGLRIVGDPHLFALDYYRQGADELLFMDVVASLYQRNNLTDIIRNAADQIYIPITVGGGVRSLDDVSKLMHSGADKITINTAAIARPALITEVSRRFGTQCMVLGVEAKQVGTDRWEAFTDNGRERTGRDVIEWVRQAVDLGAGEILLTSIDKEGMRKGFDASLLQQVCNAVHVPVIASGGFGQASDLLCAGQCGVSAIAIADVLHWKRMTVPQIKQHAQDQGLKVRL